MDKELPALPWRDGSPYRGAGSSTRPRCKSKKRKRARSQENKDDTMWEYQ